LGAALPVMLFTSMSRQRTYPTRCHMAGDINLTDEALRNAPGIRFLSANVHKHSSPEVPDVCPFC
jgi:hypothetical protein